MRSGLNIVLAPTGNEDSGLREGFNPMFVEALGAEFAVEAFDVGMLRRLARCDQQVIDAPCLHPSEEGASGDFRATIGADRAVITSKTRRLFEAAGHVSATDAVIHRRIA